MAIRLAFALASGLVLSVPAHAQSAAAFDEQSRRGDLSSVGSLVDLVLTKTVSDDRPDESSEITYTITVTNDSAIPTTGVTVDDLLPDGVTFTGVDAISQGAYDGATGLWDVGALGNGASATLDLRAYVHPGTAAVTGTGDIIDIFVNPGGGGLDAPQGIRFGPDGDLLVASFVTNEVLRYDGDTGAFIDAFVSAMSGGLDAPVSLAFGPDANLYVASSASNEVLRYDGTTGAFIDAFTAGGGLASPTGLTFGPDGSLYVSSSASNEVLRYDGATGTFIDVFVTAGSGGLDTPQGLTFGLHGNVYVASFGSDEVLRYDGSGTFVDVFAASAGLEGPRDVAFGADSNLYVPSFFTAAILRYDSGSGAFIDYFAGGSGMNFPSGFTFGPDGNLYVAPLFQDSVWRYVGFLNNVAVVSGDDPDPDLLSNRDEAGIDAQAVTGACCLGPETCSPLTAQWCGTLGGFFYGDDASCADDPCALEAGACCLLDGACLVLTPQNCGQQAGTYQPGVSCGDAGCPSPAAGGCCFDDTCVVLARTDCLVMNGVYLGNTFTCDGDACDGIAESAACCFGNGACEMRTAALCVELGGTPGDPGTHCAAPICPQPAAPTGGCCLASGGCSSGVTVQQCNAAHGQYQGDGIGCGAGSVCEPYGACCFLDAACADQRSAGDCLGAGGSYQGDGSLCSLTVCPQPDRATLSEKGSLLFFSSVELRWGTGPGPEPSFGGLLQDTFISITNDHAEDVRVLMHFIHGDPPLAEDPSTGERAHTGWNSADIEITLTGDQPTYWSVAFGQPATEGTAPFTILDPGFPPGRPTNDGTGDRVLRGYVIMWAVNDSEEEISWNHLSGVATIVDYQRGAAWEYASVNHAVVDPTIANGEPTGTPGALNLDGVEYAQSYTQLLLNFQPPGSPAFSGPRQVIGDTLLALHPVSANLQNGEPPVTTRANFEIWNANGIKFSDTTRCITYWDQARLGRYDAPNGFLLQHLQTDHGRARIDGLASAACDVDVAPDDGACGNHPGDVCSEATPLLGVSVRRLTFDGGLDSGASAVNVLGVGRDPSAVIRYDVYDPGHGSAWPSTPREMLDWLEHELGVR
ncbi:MAG: DUF11 domain-containing protein [Planctomycetes bacterium]|nr:DUF11 domain-containing protein [Planctomycetota bacterium]